MGAEIATSLCNVFLPLTGFQLWQVSHVQTALTCRERRLGSDFPSIFHMLKHKPPVTAAGLDALPLRSFTTHLSLIEMQIQPQREGERGDGLCKKYSGWMEYFSLVNLSCLRLNLAFESFRINWLTCPILNSASAQSAIPRRLVCQIDGNCWESSWRHRRDCHSDASRYSWDCTLFRLLVIAKLADVLTCLEIYEWQC